VIDRPEYFKRRDTRRMEGIQISFMWPLLCTAILDPNEIQSSEKIFLELKSTVPERLAIAHGHIHNEGRWTKQTGYRNMYHFYEEILDAEGTCNRPTAPRRFKNRQYDLHLQSLWCCCTWSMGSLKLGWLVHNAPVSNSNHC